MGFVEHPDHTWVRLDITEPSTDPGWEVCSHPHCHVKRFIDGRREEVVTEQALPLLDI
jgi:hypothetical protein